MAQLTAYSPSPVCRASLPARVGREEGARVVWVLWFLGVLVASYGLWFAYRIAPRAFVLYAAGLALVFWIFLGDGLLVLGDFLSSPIHKASRLGTPQGAAAQFDPLIVYLMLVLAGVIGVSVITKKIVVWQLLAAFVLASAIYWLMVTRSVAVGSVTPPPASEKPVPEFLARHKVNSVAPRLTSPTIFREVKPGIFMMSIDGSNEKGWSHDFLMHRSKSYLAGPREQYTFRHVGGLIPHNKRGETVGLCGLETPPPVEMKLLQPVGVYGVFVGWVTPDGTYGLTRWKCGEREMTITTPGDKGPVHLAIYFNTSLRYKCNLPGAKDGWCDEDMAVAGYNGGGAEFEIRKQ